MASFDTIFKIETAIADAVEAVLESDGLNFYDLLSTSTVSTPCVGIGVGNVREIGRKYPHTDGVIYPSAWAFDLVLEVVTDRRKNSSSHFTYLATVRKHMAQRQLSTTGMNARLASHQIADMECTGSTFAVQDEGKDRDITTINYQGVIFVKDAAWPA